MAKADSATQALAQALTTVALKEANEALDRIHFDHSDFEDFIDRLHKESATAQVLIFYSYLDDKVQTLLEQHMIGLETTTAREALFGINSPLGTFSSRIRVAYHLGWISDATRARLEAFRKVRNEFAHRAFRVSIDDPAIVAQIKLIGDDTGVKIKDAIDSTRFLVQDLDELLCKLIFLAHRTFLELMIFPIAKRVRISPGLLGNRENPPPKVAALVTMTANALSRIGMVVALPILQERADEGTG
ncbi:MAG: hypothetical protein AB7O88_05185 [Reyranellaceae bacterium]